MGPRRAVNSGRHRQQEVQCLTSPKAARSLQLPTQTRPHPVVQHPSRLHLQSAESCTQHKISRVGGSAQIRREPGARNKKDRSLWLAEWKSTEGSLIETLDPELSRGLRAVTGCRTSFRVKTVRNPRGWARQSCHLWRGLGTPIVPGHQASPPLPAIRIRLQ